MSIARALFTFQSSLVPIKRLATRNAFILRIYVGFIAWTLTFINSIAKNKPFRASKALECLRIPYIWLGTSNTVSLSIYKWLRWGTDTRIFLFRPNFVILTNNAVKDLVIELSLTVNASFILSQEGFGLRTLTLQCVNVHLKAWGTPQTPQCFVVPYVWLWTGNAFSRFVFVGFFVCAGAGLLFLGPNCVIFANNAFESFGVELSGARDAGIVFG